MSKVLNDAKARIKEDLIRRVKAHTYVSIGVGAECAYCVAREQFNKVVKELENDGYVISRMLMNSTPMLTGCSEKVSVKILSRNHLTMHAMLKNKDKWIAEANELRSLRNQQRVVHNMVRYHLTEFDVCKYRDYEFKFGRWRKHIILDKCSRLLTIMAKNKAPDEELERVIKYSMVVIDAEKKHLNYPKAKEDLKIEELEHKYFKIKRL